MAKRINNPYLEDTSSIHWMDTKLDYTSGDLDYKGSSLSHKASTSASELWWIWKYTWDGTDLVRIEGPLTGNWDDRASLDWI